ncbi:TPA: hypothetical protein MO340_004307 [Salmonella enterica subsp. salamae serovar 35:g,m,s,t:-]|nr:hypothetical protein [Salmonella enterica subsp. salamae serovar 35:g,m,s,t:-]HCA3549777.1 hypothetical protein [Salmonella enterica subsp. salamae serovar 35:g,m,s,t:-]
MAKISRPRLSLLQETVLQRLAKGDVLIHDVLVHSFCWKDSGKNCTLSAKALLNRGLIYGLGARSPHWVEEIHITASGRAIIAERPQN